MVLKIIILLIIILLIIWFAWYLYQRNRGNGSSTTHDDIENKYIPDPKPIINSTTIRDQYNILSSFEIKLLSNPSAGSGTKKLKTLDFRTYVHVVENDRAFLISYVKAIELGYQLKLQRYYAEVEAADRAIRSYEAKDEGKGFLGGIIGKPVTNASYDSTYERHQYARTELGNLCNIILQKMKDLHPDKLKSQLQRAIYDQKNGFGSLIGREAIKDKFCQIIHAFSKSPDNFVNNYNNFIVVGEAGVGKTKLCETIGFIFAHSGILARGTVSKITSTDLTSAFVSESEQITRHTFFRSLEGVLHFEEIYSLCPSKLQDKMGHMSHGKSSQTELVYLIEKYRGCSINCASGYKDKMDEQFLGTNQGMSRRWPHYIHLTEYNATQLNKLLLEFLIKNCPNIFISSFEQEYTYTLLSYVYKEHPKVFRNQAGDMENLASCIATAINSSIEYYWSPNNSAINKELIDIGFDAYLQPHGISLSCSLKNNN